MTDDIIQSAKKAAAAMLEDAEAERNEAEESVRASLEKAKLESDADAARAADAAYAGRIKLGELEASKVLLDAKQRIVAEVYEGVRERILKASSAEYLKLMQKLVVEAAEDGDEIIAPAGDKRITAAWVKKVSTAAKKKLKLSSEKGDFEAGVILRNQKYDRDLTVDEIVADLKERTVAETAQKLGL